MPAIPRELVTLSFLVGDGTSLDFDLDSCHVVAGLEDGWDACGSISIAVTYCWG